MVTLLLVLWRIARYIIASYLVARTHFKSQGKFVGVFDLGRMPISVVMLAAAQGWTQFTYCLSFF
jgi:hypothetical protein